MPKGTGGHWPKGVRRNADNGDWETVRLGITALIDEHFEKNGTANKTSLAAACGANEKSVRNWLSGVDRPAEEHQAVCRAWLKERRDEIKRRRGSKP